MFLAIQISLNYDIWFTLFMMTSGGLLFGATFMATDPVTSPVTKIGQVIYGICLGLLTVFFRMLSPAPEGVLTSILTMNMFVIIINNYTIINKYKFSKIIRPFIFVAAMAALILYGVYYKKVLEPDSTLKIYDIKINGEEITYHAGERGYVGYINAEITIKNNKILKYEITDQSESFYKKIEDAN